MLQHALRKIDAIGGDRIDIVLTNVIAYFVVEFVPGGFLKPLIIVKFQYFYLWLCEIFLWIFYTTSLPKITWGWIHLLHLLSEYLDVKINTLSSPKLEKNMVRQGWSIHGMDDGCYQLSGWSLILQNKRTNHNISTGDDWHQFLDNVHSLSLNSSPLPKSNEKSWIFSFSFE